MGWEIGGGGEAKVVVGWSCARAEHRKVRGNQNGKGDEGRRAGEGRFWESWMIILDEVKSRRGVKRGGYA